MVEKINYQLMRKSHISNIQSAYKECIIAQAKYLKNTWINDEGELCFSPTLLNDMTEKIEVYKKAVEEYHTFTIKYGDKLKENKDVR